MASSASKLTIDNETWQAIREGRVDLRHASKELRAAAVEIGFGVSRRRGFFDRLLHGEEDSFAVSEQDMELIKANLKRNAEEQLRMMDEHANWSRANRLKTVPRSYTLQAANQYGHSYSDGRGNILHYNLDGSRMNARQEHEYLDMIYGSGD